VSARERILATARELFYREGIRAIVVDTVVERSGVSKTSLYRLFDSKDALIATVAAEQDRLFWAWWNRTEEQHADDPRALLDALLSGIAKRIEHPMPPRYAIQPIKSFSILPQVSRFPPVAT